MLRWPKIFTMHKYLSHLFVLNTRWHTKINSRNQWTNGKNGTSLRLRWEFVRELGDSRISTYFTSKPRDAFLDRFFNILSLYNCSISYAEPLSSSVIGTDPACESDWTIYIKLKFSCSSANWAVITDLINFSFLPFYSVMYMVNRYSQLHNRSTYSHFSRYAGRSTSYRLRS